MVPTSWREVSSCIAARSSQCPSSVRKQPTDRATVLFAVLPILLAIGTLGAAQDVGQTVPADDLPAEIRMLSGADPDRDYRWTLVGTNGKAQEQEALHPELNVVEKVWHCPLARDRQAFKFEFTRSFKEKSHVFHLYVKADGDADTGRIAKGSMKGVDYMFTLSEGAPGARRDSWSRISADGQWHGAPHLTVVKDDVLYLSANMTIQQQDDASVFEYYVMSYVAKNTEKGLQAVASSNFGFKRAVSEAAPTTSVGTGPTVINPDLRLINGVVPGWQLIRGRRRIEAVLAADNKGEAVSVSPLFSPEGLAQTVSLAPGHYLLRGLAKTNVYQIHLFADRTRIPVAVSDDHQWAELPFYVPRSDKDSRRSVQIGFRYLARPATGNASRLPAKLSAKKVELIRLGDTALYDRWAETLPADPLHRMQLINESPAWSRPGKVVFQDAFVGTELWLMTQEGKIDHSYVGHPDFSHDGKYLHIGSRRAPRGLLRTDGSARYLNDKWAGLVWLFPWMERRLPEGSDPADWIITSRSGTEVRLHSVVTKESHRLALPSRPGWGIVHYPGMASYGGRGPRIGAIAHETLVWVSQDQKSVGLSNIEGEAFRAFKVRSTSKRPEEDAFHPDMSSVGGKSGGNWRDAVDRDGKRHHLFELNRDNLPNHPTNPYQVWALCMTKGDERGLLRVVFHPRATMTEFVTSQTGMTRLPSANWWDFAAGFPWSGDNAILLLEDGTLVHMSSVGMHSSFQGGNTVSVNCAYSGEVRFFGTFPRFDRITWPHEFRRDRDFAVVASHAQPASPLMMIDLEHTTMWTVALTNFHDYSMRYRTRWNKKAYHKPMFRPAPTFSPDFTKVSYFSAMLTGDHPDRKWGDLYVAVVRYPQPPVNLRMEGNALVWEKPRYSAEIKGFRLYRSEKSGQNYERAGEGLLTGITHELPADSEGFYVLTSVEHSGLESRVFSNEARVGPRKEFRHFYQTETGKIMNPMVPVFDPAGAGGAYAVAITDPELIYKKRLDEGLTASVRMRVVIPEAGNVRIMARVRGLSALERSSYTRGWPPTGEVGRGRFAVRINGKGPGKIPVDGSQWRWVALDTGALELSAGTIELEFATSDTGIAVDSILVTDDADFVPRGRGPAPEKLAAVPRGLRAGTFGPEDAELMKVTTPRVKLAWEPVVAPQGVSHYNVYRADTGSFAADTESLLGSPAETVFYDCGLEAGQKVFYRVRATDAWGNQSPASAAVAVTAASPSVRAAFRVLPDPGAGKGTTFTFDAAQSQADVGQINGWQWAFGDGASAQGASVTHTFAAPGTYIVRLKIGSDRGEWATAEQSLYVRPGWIRTVLGKGAVWVEAESKSREGGGVSRLLTGRVNASGSVLTYWQKDVGHWLEWDVLVPKTGFYAIVLKYASGSSRVVRDCRLDGQFPNDEWKRLVFPRTGGFSISEDNWAWQALRDKDGRPLRVELTGGSHVVRMANLEGGMALDAFLLIPFDALPSSL